MTNKEAIERLKRGAPFDEIYDETYEEAISLAIKALEERPKGEWVEKEDYVGDTYYDCSNCGNSWSTLEGTPWQNGMSFCPNCGADMRGDV